jgi:hypothetical protein
MTFSAMLSAAALLFALLQVPNAIATFDGVFKTANSKFIEIQVESGDTMRMYLTHGTKFVKEGKSARAGDFHDGDKVTVDAERDVRMNLLAVRVESTKAEAKKPK